MAGENVGQTPGRQKPATGLTKAELLAKLPPAEPLRSPALAAHQARLRAHRATAFLRYAPVIAGLRLRPVSLRSLELLAAFGVDLARGRFDDLARFVWVHHPAFDQFAALRRRLVFAWLWLRLAPPRAFAAALAEAREQLTRARLDWPAGDDSAAGSPLPCAFSAYALDLWRARYPGSADAEVLDQPLVEIVQRLRAIIHATNPRAALLDATEAALFAAELPAPPETPPAAP
jgi:hypothetical protein